MSSEPTPQPGFRLNLFALPNQTTLLFGVILVVLGLPIVRSACPFLPWPFLPLLIFCLTLWDFLQRPDRLRSQYDLPEISLADENNLTERVVAVGTAVGMRHLPLPLISRSALPNPHAFGTWRQRYLALPPSMLAADADPRQREMISVVLQHELAHFANGDVWLTCFARSFLKMSIISLFAIWFGLIWTPFLYTELLAAFPDWTQLIPTLLLEQVPSDVVMFLQSPRAWSPAEVIVYIGMVGAATWPLILGAVILFVVTWNQLLQVREVYCDARVASWRGERRQLLRAFSYQFFISEQPKSSTGLTRLWQSALVRLKKALHLPEPFLSGPVRQRAVNRPETVLGTSRQVGMRAGFAVLLLHLLLTSTFAPGLRGIGSEIVTGFGFTVLAVGLTPLVVVALPSWRVVLRVLAPAAGIYMVIFNGAALLLGVGLAAIALTQTPGQMDLWLNATFYAIVMMSPGENVNVDLLFSQYMGQIIPGSLFLMVVGLPLLLVLFLLVDVFFKRQMLTWYTLPLLRQRPQVLFWGISLGLALLLWFGAVPLLNVLAFPWIFAADPWLWVQIGVAWGVALAVLTAGLWLHKRYARRCPTCDETVPDPFAPGRACPHCGKPLTPWLQAAY
ncbi:MAG: hypothetical protein KF893_09925 [Caldilineaceae bacterium]|nr:hypothetical protein [Caldilineaceae bacterium]